MPDETNPLDCQTPSDEHFDPSKSNRLDNTDHPKNLYVSPADFEWLLRYLEEDEDSNELTNC